MKHDFLTEAMMRRAIKKAASDKARQEEKIANELDSVQQLKRKIKQLEERRQLIHDAREYLKSVEMAIMEHFGKKK